jgi:leucyl-tRNA synthetase
MWELLGHKDSIFNSAWPAFDPAALVRDTVEIAVQINGTVRYRVDIRSAASEEEVRAVVVADPKMTEFLAGREIVKFIYVKGRLANLVVR